MDLTYIVVGSSSILNSVFATPYPINTDLSRSGCIFNSSNIPTTPNHSFSIKIFVGIERSLIPNLVAVTLPKTVTGISLRPSFIKRPSVSFPPTTSNNSDLVTRVEIPPPSNSDIKSVLLTNKSVCVVEVTSCTGPILSTIPRTPSGKFS